MKLLNLVVAGLLTVPALAGCGETNAIPTADRAAEMNLEQVGQIIGVTKERVRQIQNKALEKIRLTLEEARLEEAQQAGQEPTASDDDSPYLN